MSDPLFYSHFYPANATVQRGWECPKCGAVMAPWMPNCVKCPAKATATEIGAAFCANCGRHVKDCVEAPCDWRKKLNDGRS